MLKIFTYLSFVLLTLLVNLEQSSAQTSYSLDSIYSYADGLQLNSIERINFKDVNGRALEATKELFNSDGTLQSDFYQKFSYEYHPDGLEKLSNTYQCYPFRDTCFLTISFGQNEFGHRDRWLERSLQAVSEPNSLDIFFDEIRVDSFVINTNGIIESVYRFFIDNLFDEKTLIERRDYFYNLNNQQDSVYIYENINEQWVYQCKIINQYPDSLTELIYEYKFGQVELIQNLYELIDGQKRIKSIASYSIFGQDSILRFDQIYEYFDSYYNYRFNFYDRVSGDIFNGVFGEYFLLDNNVTIDSASFKILLPNSSDYVQAQTAKYYYSDFVSSTSEYSSEEQVLILPNPAQDFIQLKASQSFNSEPLEFKIFDIIGRIVHSGIYTSSPIQVSSLVEGNYFLILENGINLPFFIVR